MQEIPHGGEKQANTPIWSREARDFRDTGPQSTFVQNRAHFFYSQMDGVKDNHGPHVRATITLQN